MFYKIYMIHTFLVQKNKWPITCDIELEYTIPEGSDAVKEVVNRIKYCRKALVR